MAGYIKLHRKVTEWEWYGDINTTRVFIHLLLKANYKPTKYKGKMIPRGSLVTTLPKLSEETALTVKEVRTAISHLKSTGELGIQTTNRESVIKVLKYSLYQVEETDNGQSTGSQGAVQGQSKGKRTEEEIEEREEIKNIIPSISPLEEPKGRTKRGTEKTIKFIPPTLEEVSEYGESLKSSVDPKVFHAFYQTSDWIDSKGNRVRNWKQKFISWDNQEKKRMEASPKNTKKNTTYDLDWYDRETRKAIF